MVTNEGKIVLPDTLVAQLIGNAADLSRHLKVDFDLITSMREEVRKKLIARSLIVKVKPATEPLTTPFTIDGAHLAEVDRASAYSASCAVGVGKDAENNAQSSCLAMLPHVPSISSVSGGLMAMQEIMMAVHFIEKDPEAVVMIDGSKISAIIAINQFYAGIEQDLPGQLGHWRKQGKEDKTREPGNTLNIFEGRDWLSTYLASDRIVGNLKLVTTNLLVKEYAPDLIGRFDDKTLASLILEDGEALGPIALETPKSPFHIAQGYPFSKDFDSFQVNLYKEKSDEQILYVYYRPDTAHGVFKIEINHGFLKSGKLNSLFTWWNNEIKAPDLQEPYSYFIADRFAKEAVSVAKNALKEITRRDSSAWSWFFTRPYRTE